MKISVVGSGCPTCEALYNQLKKLKTDKRVDAEIEYIRDVNELIKRGIMGSPALLIDDKPILIGVPENEDKLLEIIKKSSR